MHMTDHSKKTGLEMYRSGWGRDWGRGGAIGDPSWLFKIKIIFKSIMPRSELESVLRVLLIYVNLLAKFGL